MRTRRQWTTRSRDQRAYADSDTRAILAEQIARAETVRALSDADLTAEADRLREQFVADNTLALDPEWSRYSNLVITEQRTRKG